MLDRTSGARPSGRSLDGGDECLGAYDYGHVPAVLSGLLLNVDSEYRQRAARGDLPVIAPKRFNPEKKPWLPIMHDVIGDWHFTAMFSNTARAHQLHRTDDWVVIYFYDNDHEEGQHKANALCVVAKRNA